MSLLSRSELGDEFSLACRVAMAELRRNGRSAKSEWRHHPMVEAVLDEIVLRHLEYEAARDRHFLLYEALLPPE